MLRIFLALWLALTPAFAFAGSLALLGAGQAPGGGVAPTLSFVATAVLAGSGSTATSATVNIGNPSYIATRRVIVTCEINVGSNGPITGVTINGVSATVHVDSEPANQDWLSIFSAVVTSGTTNVTVTITYTGTQFGNNACGVYNVDNSLLNSVTPTTGTGTSGASTVTSQATSAAVSTSAGGFIVAVASLGASASSGLAFTGMTTDGFGGASNALVSSQGSLAGGNLTPTATWVGAQTASVAAAAWR